MTKAVVDYTMDEDADAIYVRLADKPYAYGEDIDHERRVDYAADKTPIGVELLSVSHGVDLSDLPAAHEIAKILEREGVRQFA